MGPRILSLIVVTAGCLVARADPSFPTGPRFVERVHEELPPPDPSADIVYVCPMDPEIRSHDAGTCKRCGMRLVAGIPDPVEFHLALDTIPATLTASKPAVLQFTVHDPWKDRPVASYNVVHEKLFHAFVVSEDLEFFQHAHPALVSDGIFQSPIRFPTPGMYRILSDFYPAGATPQLTTETVIVPGPSSTAPAQLTRDYSPKSGENMRVSLTTTPKKAVAGMRMQLRFTIDPTDGLEKYLGAWGHMLAASNDLIDMMHEHPYRVDEHQMVEFEIVFPRPQVYRVWVQFQRKGVVNTVHFDIPVRASK